MDDPSWVLVLYSGQELFFFGCLGNKIGPLSTNLCKVLEHLERAQHLYNYMLTELQKTKNT